MRKAKDIAHYLTHEATIIRTHLSDERDDYGNPIKAREREDIACFVDFPKSKDKENMSNEAVKRDVRLFMKYQDVKVGDLVEISMLDDTFEVVGVDKVADMQGIHHLEVYLAK